MRLNKNIWNYQDQNGLFGQRNILEPNTKFERVWIELGDGANRTGLFLIAKWFGLWTHPNPNPLKHEVSPGKYIRGPGGYWYSDPRTFSRDQATSYIIGCGLDNYLGIVLRSLWANIKRFGFFANTRKNWTDGNEWKLPDVMTPETFAAYLRAIITCYKDIKIAWVVLYSLFFPFLLLGDFFAIFTSTAKVIKSHQDKKHSDDLTRIALLIQAWIVPTPISFIARSIYKRRYQGPLWSLRYYFSSQASPPIDDLLEPIVNQVFK